MRRPGGDPGLFGDTALLITVDVFVPNIYPPFCYSFLELVGELGLTILVDVLAMLVVFVAFFGEGEAFAFTVLRLIIETLYLFTWRGGEGDADYFYFKAYCFYCFYPNVSRVFRSDSFYYC